MLEQGRRAIVFWGVGGQQRMLSLYQSHPSATKSLSFNIFDYPLSFLYRVIWLFITTQEWVKFEIYLVLALIKLNFTDCGKRHWPRNIFFLNDNPSLSIFKRQVSRSRKTIINFIWVISCCIVKHFLVNITFICQTLIATGYFSPHIVFYILSM